IEIPHSNETIIFDYYKVKYSYASSHTITNKVHFTQTGNPVVIPSGSNTFATVTEYLPKSVEYNQVKVNFKYKMNGSKFKEREDVDNVTDHSLIGIAGGILEKIQVETKTNNTVIKNFKLNTGYFTSNNNENIPQMWGEHNTTRPVLFKRLKLESIQEFLSDIRYEFEYYGELTNQFLPPRFSYKTDYWGMYNGKNNTTELHDYTITENGKKHYYPGADKSPDGIFAKIGSLKKVFLPTGGYQEFEYELDEFKNTDDNTVFYPVYDYEEKEYELFNESFEYVSTTFDDYIINITPPAPDYRIGFNHIFSLSTNDEPELINNPNDLPQESH